MQLFFGRKKMWGHHNYFLQPTSLWLNTCIHVCKATRSYIQTNGKQQGSWLAYLWNGCVLLSRHHQQPHRKNANCICDKLIIANFGCREIWAGSMLMVSFKRDSAPNTFFPPAHLTQHGKTMDIFRPSCKVANNLRLRSSSLLTRWGEVY